MVVSCHSTVTCFVRSQTNFADNPVLFSPQGDVITIILEDESGWWQGQNQKTGDTGIFPAVYLAAQEDGAVVSTSSNENSDTF